MWQLIWTDNGKVGLCFLCCITVVALYFATERTAEVNSMPIVLMIGGAWCTLLYLIMTSIAIDCVQEGKINYCQVLYRFWLPTFVLGVSTMFLSSTAAIFVRPLMIINFAQLLIIEVPIMKVK